MSEVRLIDANALKAKIKSKYDNDDAEFDRGYNIGLQAAVDLIDSAPTLPNPCDNPCNFTRPIGKWINSVDILTDRDIFTCSRCRMPNAVNKPYCPNCGARMEAENGR